MGNMEKKVILVDYEIQEKILHEIETLKQLLSEKALKKVDSGIQWMDNKELMEYRRDLIDAFVSNRR